MFRHADMPDNLLVTKIEGILNQFERIVHHPVLNRRPHGFLEIFALLRFCLAPAAPIARGRRGRTAATEKTGNVSENLQRILRQRLRGWAHRAFALGQGISFGRKCGSREFARRRVAYIWRQRERERNKGNEKTWDAWQGSVRRKIWREGVTCAKFVPAARVVRIAALLRAHKRAHGGIFASRTPVPTERSIPAGSSLKSSPSLARRRSRLCPSSLLPSERREKGGDRSLRSAGT